MMWVILVPSVENRLEPPRKHDGKRRTLLLGVLRCGALLGLGGLVWSLVAEPQEAVVIARRRSL